MRTFILTHISGHTDLMLERPNERLQVWQVQADGDKQNGPFTAAWQCETGCLATGMLLSKEKEAEVDISASVAPAASLIHQLLWKKSQKINVTRFFSTSVFFKLPTKISVLICVVLYIILSIISNISSHHITLHHKIFHLKLLLCALHNFLHVWTDDIEFCMDKVILFWFVYLLLDYYRK